MTISFVDECLAVLGRTPDVLQLLLRGLPEVWTNATDGANTWNAYDVLGHLIHAERADWMPRLFLILEHGESRPFEPFDREAQFRENQGKSLNGLLDEFTSLRAANLTRLRELNLGNEQLALKGSHPALGTVTARQLLATWTAHDLAHLLQISRTMARRFKGEVGPWAEYLSVMKPA